MGYGYDFNVTPVQVENGTDYQARKDAAAARKIELQQRQIELAQAQKAQKLQDTREVVATSSYGPKTTNLGNMQLPGGYGSIPMGSVQGPAQLDRGAYTQGLQKAGYGYEAMQADQQFQQQDAEQQKAQVAFQDSLVTAKSHQLELATKQLDLGIRMLGGVKNAPPDLQPQVYQGVRQQGIQAGIIQPNDPQYPEQFPGAPWLDQKLNSALTTKEQIDNELKRKEMGSKTVQTAEGVMQFNPGTGKYDQNIGKLPKTVPPAVNVSLGGGQPLSTDAVDQSAQLYLQTGQLPSLGMGKDAANFRRQILNRAAELGKGENIASNKASFGADKGSLQKVQGMLDAVEAYESTAKKNLGLFITQAKKISDSGSPLLNKPLRAFDEKVLGDPQMSAYRTARQVALTEIARVVNNPNLTGVLSDSARHELADFNPESATLAQTLKIATILNQDMDNRHEALKGQRDSIKGRLGGSKPTLTNQNGGGAEIHYKIVNGQLVAQ